MKSIDIIKLTIEECNEIYWKEQCPKCHERLKTNYYNSDGGSWECLECDIEYWAVF